MLKSLLTLIVWWLFKYFLLPLAYDLLNFWLSGWLLCAIFIRHNASIESVEFFDSFSAVFRIISVSVFSSEIRHFDKYLVIMLIWFCSREFSILLIALLYFPGCVGRINDFILIKLPFCSSDDCYYFFAVFASAMIRRINETIMIMASAMACTLLISRFL